uniref:Uncharacterized protein n=1 Tax=Setaria italica TaxID=4555 RepID=K3YKF9_SETIT
MAHLGGAAFGQVTVGASNQLASHVRAGNLYDEMLLKSANAAALWRAQSTRADSLQCSAAVQGMVFACCSAAAGVPSAFIVDLIVIFSIQIDPPLEN